jgi:hypothetical protein
MMDVVMWWLKVFLIWAGVSLILTPFIGRFVGGRSRDRDPG